MSERTYQKQPQHKATDAGRLAEPAPLAPAASRLEATATLLGPGYAGPPPLAPAASRLEATATLLGPRYAGPAAMGAPVQRRAQSSPGAGGSMFLTKHVSVARKGEAAGTTGLPASLKAGVESLSGLSLDEVRVHPNSEKPAQMRALAYTHGAEIHVAPGQERHLPHEAWHVVQQAEGRVQATSQLKGMGLSDDAGLEREADVMGARAASQGGGAPVAQGQRAAQPAIGEGGLVAPGRRAVQRVRVNEAEEIARTYLHQAVMSGALDPEYVTDVWTRLMNLADKNGRVMDTMNVIDAVELLRSDDANTKEEEEQQQEEEEEQQEEEEKKEEKKEKPFGTEGRQQRVQKYKNDKSKLREIVWVNHWDAISAVCKEKNYIISIRETGAPSIKRIAQGAKAKPHTILEKSIKTGSVSKAYDPSGKKKNLWEQIMKVVEALDLDGFVGHWDQSGLIGVRIDGFPAAYAREVGALQLDGKPATEPTGQLYVPLALNAEGGGPSIKKLKRLENWKTYLYTGDYDLHEALQYGGKQTAEGSQEKATLLSRLNAGIAQTDPSREGEAKLEKENGKLAIHVHGAHAMFQHGDQATYIANQYNERKEGQRADLVPVVAAEADEPVAWCLKGIWYVTNSRREHQDFRDAHGLITPEVWTVEGERRLLKRKTVKGLDDQRKKMEKEDAEVALRRQKTVGVQQKKKKNKKKSPKLAKQKTTWT